MTRSRCRTGSNPAATARSVPAGTPERSQLRWFAADAVLTGPGGLRSPASARSDVRRRLPPRTPGAGLAQHVHVECGDEQQVSGVFVVRSAIGRVPQERSSRGKIVSVSRMRMAAATGMAMSAPMIPRTAPPNRTATTVTVAGTSTALPMILGTIR